MAKPRLIYYRLLQWRPENLAAAGRTFELVELQDPRDDSDEILASAEACCAPLGFRFDEAKMARCTRLRAILSNTTGVPHIDMAAAAARDIAVFSLKDEQAFLDTITPTAEHAWGLLLALSRRLPWCFADVTAGRWQRFDWGTPRMLSRMTLGIVGYGRLGRRVASYGRAFGMPVRFYDPFKQADDVAGKCSDLGELAGWSDVLSLHVPALPETRHLIDARILAAMRPEAVLINTARAELVDEAALLHALQDGRLAGYAADVLEGEFDPGFQAGCHPLVRHARKHQNIVLTPHVGGSTVDAWSETQRRVIDMAVGHFQAAGP